MKLSPIIIKVPAVQAIKLPLGEWVNLASVRGVEIGEDSDSLVPINHLIVRLTRRKAGGAFDTDKPLSLFRCESSSVTDSPN
jgi:hypothetical protein